MAQQNSNLSIKFKALRHLRELLKEAAEMSGLTANVSQTIPGPNGSHTTFQAKQLAMTLNPTKQNKSKEIANEQEEFKEKKLDLELLEKKLHHYLFLQVLEKE